MSVRYTIDISDSLIVSGFKLPERLRIVGFVGQKRNPHGSFGYVYRTIIEDYAGDSSLNGKHCFIRFNEEFDRISVLDVEVIEDV